MVAGAQAPVAPAGHESRVPPPPPPPGAEQQRVADAAAHVASGAEMQAELAVLRRRALSANVVWENAGSSGLSLAPSCAASVDNGGRQLPGPDKLGYEIFLLRFPPHLTEYHEMFHGNVEHVYTHKHTQFSRGAFATSIVIYNSMAIQYFLILCPTPAGARP